MKKFKLQLDDLQIESFSTQREEGKSEGTVRGYITLYCESDSCQWCATLSDCLTGCGCGTRYEGGTCDYPTCAPTCAGGTCQYQTCNGC